MPKIYRVFRPVALVLVALGVVVAPLVPTTIAGASVVGFLPASVAPIPSPAGEPTGSATMGVSCWSAGNCTALANYGRVDTANSSFVENEINGVWQAATEIQSPNPASDPYSYLNGGGSSISFSAISCSSQGNCVAVGSSVNFGIMAVETAGTWGQSTYAVPPLVSSNDYSLQAVSCASNGNCVAGGQYLAGSGVLAPFIVVRSGGVWQSATRVVLPSDAATSPVSGRITAISCPQANACAMVGDYTTNVGAGTGFVGSVSSGVASTTTSVTLPGDSALSPRSELTGVSCVDATDCIAVGDYATATSGQALAVPETSGVWGAGVNADPSDPKVNFLAISCSFDGSCNAVGDAYGSGHQVIVVPESAGTWGTEQTVPMPTLVVASTSAYAAAISCSDVSECTVGLQNSGASTDHATASTSSSGVFATPVALNPPSDLLVNESSQLYDTSCLGTTCTSLGSFLNYTHKYQYFVETFVSGVPTGTVALSPSFALEPGGGTISCPSPGDCTAISAGGSPYIFTEYASAWGTGTPLNAGNNGTIAAISCSSSSYCLAVGSGEQLISSVWYPYGIAVTITPSGTAISYVTPPVGFLGYNNSVLNGVSCWADGACEAVGAVQQFAYNQYAQPFLTTFSTGVAVSSGVLQTSVIVKGPGGSQNFGDDAYLNGVSCPSPGDCLAVGAFQPSEGSIYIPEVSTWASLASGTWTSQNKDVPPANSNPTTIIRSSAFSRVSCSDNSDCVAVGGYNATTNVEQGLAAQGSFSSLGSTVPLTAPYSGSVDPTTEQSYSPGVACYSATACLIVGSYRSLVDQQFYATYTNTGNPPPGPPLLVTATHANNSLLVSWQAPFANGGTAPTSYTAHAGPSSCTTSTLSCTIPGLVNGQSYSVYVTATNIAGTGQVSTSTTGTPSTVPGTPTGLYAVVDNQQVTLTWTPHGDGGSPITTAYVNVSWPGTGNHTLINCQTTTSTCIIPGLTSGTAYTFAVKELNVNGGSAFSNAVVATPVTVPSAPFDVVALPLSKSLKVSWIASNSGGTKVTGYTVSVGTKTCVTTLLTCTVAGLTNKTHYTVTVVATNARGTSVPSLPVTAAPGVLKPRPPGPVRSLKGMTATPGYATLTWKAPLAANEGLLRYAIWESPNGTTWTPLVNTLKTNPSYTTIYGAFSGVTHFRVCAVGLDGQVSTAVVIKVTIT